jgi:hypothetical protein
MRLPLHMIDSMAGGLSHALALSREGRLKPLAMKTECCIVGQADGMKRSDHEQSG